MRFVSTDSKKKFSPELVGCDLKLNRFFACLLEAVVRAPRSSRPCFTCSKLVLG